MNIEELLDELDEMVDKAWSLPGGRTVVNSEKIRILIDDIRLNMPQEIKQARGIVADRTDIINSAKREADNVVRLAEERSRAMVAKEEVTKTAQAKAAEIVAHSQSKAREMRRAAQDFVDDIMRRCDDSLTQNLAEVRKTRASLRHQVPQANQGQGNQGKSREKQ